VRTVHGIPGANLGYRDGSGKYPDYYIDSLPPVRDVGRGSPVGVEFYTSYAYPREFFDNLFEADWSRGRLLYTALTPNGATYTARSDRAEFVHGEPFNITDVEVGPDGMLYFTTGGRNTAGGLWRLRYKGNVPAPPDMTGAFAVVRQPQPLSSWGWAAIEKVKLRWAHRSVLSSNVSRATRPRRIRTAHVRCTRCSATGQHPARTCSTPCSRTRMLVCGPRLSISPACRAVSRKEYPRPRRPWQPLA
jgi:hypothetical protein